jgi:lipid-A-disaccharide synthase
VSAPRVFLVAAEPSGDLLGADLARALKAANPDVVLAGVGGPAMAAEGIDSAADISGLSVLGLFDGFRILKLVNQRAEETAVAAREFGADAVVLIDSWGFMLRAAWKTRERHPGALRIKYVGPQVFATRPKRARTLAEAVDHLLAIHPFDPPYFEPYGLNVTFVGNPALERDLSGDGPAFRARHGVETDATLALVLFGSRRSELTRLFPHFAETIARLSEARPGVRFAAPLAPAIADEARAVIAADPRLSILITVDGDERLDAFAAADLALACSGTATLELARVGVPTVAAYRLGWMSWALARAVLMKSRYISLTNIAAGEELIAERVQTRANAASLVPALLDLIDDQKLRTEMPYQFPYAAQHLRRRSGIG